MISIGSSLKGGCEKEKQPGSLRTGQIKSAASPPKCRSPKLFPVDKDAGRVLLTFGHTCMFITFFGSM